MSRDDSFLYSGITSVSNEPKTPRELQKLEKDQARQKLIPAYEYVLQEISKQREAITDLRSIILDRTSTSDEINTDLLARKLFLNYLNGFEAKIKNIMADKPQKKGKL